MIDIHHGQLTIMIVCAFQRLRTRDPNRGVLPILAHNVWRKQLRSNCVGGDRPGQNYKPSSELSWPVSLIPINNSASNTPPSLVLIPLIIFFFKKKGCIYIYICVCVCVCASWPTNIPLQLYSDHSAQKCTRREKKTNKQTTQTPLRPFSMIRPLALQTKRDWSPRTRLHPSIYMRSWCICQLAGETVSSRDCKGLRAMTNSKAHKRVEKAYIYITHIHVPKKKNNVNSNNNRSEMPIETVWRKGQERSMYNCVLHTNDALTTTNKVVFQSRFARSGLDSHSNQQTPFSILYTSVCSCLFTEWELPVSQPTRTSAGMSYGNRLATCWLEYELPTLAPLQLEAGRGLVELLLRWQEDWNSRRQTVFNRCRCERRARNGMK